MKKYLPFVIVIGVGLLTIGGGTLLYRAKRLPASTSKTSPAPTPGQSESLHVRGEAAAPVTLEEFGDYQCPPCGTLAGFIKQLEKDQGAKLRVIFRQFPLPMHEHAMAAACAAEAAGLQGRFWEMHDLLYQEQANWSKGADVPAMFKAYAGTLGLEIDRFIKDMESEKVKNRVTSDQDFGVARGVSSTPTIFVNGTMVPAPSLNPDGLRAAIEATSKQKSPPK
jgi:protein-disulfide isomerase